jgi:hypothetical protein
MTKFLHSWYKYFEGASWHNAHLRFGKIEDAPDWANYYGYFAWEAAAMVYLYDLDDSAYRNHVLYPKDLVDWAFKQGKAPKSYVPDPSSFPIQLAAHPGEPCPKAGKWFCPNLKNREVTLQLGEPMPGVNQRGSFGMPIWYYCKEQ